ncbi:hypothetical protein BDL97_08G045400, partial [Sphagnum fallax]
ELLGGRDNSINFTSCAKGQWGTQVKIYKLLLESSFCTFEKEKVDFFFVPAYVKCVHMMGGLTDTEISDIYSKTSCFLFSWPSFQDGRSILGITGDRIDKQSTSSFNTSKDVIIPGKESSVIQPLPLAKHKFLATFLGCAQGKQGWVQLIKLGKQFPQELDAPVLGFQGPAKLDHKEYWTCMGESSWTICFYETFFCGVCVPVILSDEIDLPFQNVLDYNYDIERMIAAQGCAVRCLWLYVPENNGCSAMVGILWELQCKVRVFHQSHETFWIHKKSFCRL